MGARVASKVTARPSSARTVIVAVASAGVAARFLTSSSTP